MSKFKKYLKKLQNLNMDDTLINKEKKVVFDLFMIISLIIDFFNYMFKI